MAEHDEEEHDVVQQAVRRVSRRQAKKRRRMSVSGKSVFVLNTLIRNRTESRRAAWRKLKRRRKK